MDQLKLQEKLDSIESTVIRIDKEVTKLRIQVAVLFTGASIAVSAGVTVLVNWLIS